MKKIQETINAQLAKRHKNPGIQALKINLYNAHEVRAVKQAIDNLKGYRGFTTPDCFMVGDSLLTTHLGCKNTHLETLEEQNAFILLMLKSIEDVRTAMNELFITEPPYLMGDLPDGASSSEQRLLMVSEKMLQHGADIVKLEVASKNDIALIGYLAKNGIPVAAHVGFTPQKNNNRQYGRTLQEALELIDVVRLARDNGASVIILERIAEIINRVLCAPSKESLPIYSIFSGKVPGGGQSLNVWDSVYKPTFKALFFPPTSRYKSDTYPKTYTQDTIADCFCKLLKMTLDGEFPKSPSTTLSTDDILYLESISPWTSQLLNMDK